MTNAELIAEIAKLQTALNLPLTNTTRVRKAELIEIRDALAAELGEAGFELATPARTEETLPITTTNVEPSRVAVVVQSGTRLLWGTLINVVNRRTRYSAPLLCTVELESGLRQLVAADDVLAA